MRKTLQLICIAIIVTFTASAWATTLDKSRHVFVKMVNGPKYAELDDETYNNNQGTYDNYYYIKADGGGLNQLHIATDPDDNVYGQDSAVNAVNGTASGTFYISTTGGRGYNDDVILMVSVKPNEGQLPANLSVNIKSSGYAFPLSTPGSASYSSDVIDATYTASDFTSNGYGLHPYKPGPNGITDDYYTWNLPLYTDQSDFNNGEQILFIDLKLGNIKDLDGSLGLTKKGSVKVNYSISGLTTAASFNAYGWCYESNQGQGINWTQNTKDESGTSSYRLTYTSQ
jgi:hypothetical protein